MKFVVCINNKDYPVDILLHKIYRVIPDPNMEPGDIRVVDESGEDYIYPKSYFIPIKVPVELKESFLTPA